MIWLLSNLWWLVGAVFAVVALGFVLAGPGLPVLLAALRRVPWQAWAGLVVVALLGLTFQAGRWYERSATEKRQEAAEKRADAKADKVAEKSDAAAGKARDTIRKESNDAQAEVRTIIRTVPATCHELPPRVRDLGEQALEGARREVLPASGR